MATGQFNLAWPLRSGAQLANRVQVDALRVQLMKGISTRGAALMGVLNATPDSFYDGGRYPSADRLLSRVDELIELGVDILDIGGESSRPGSEPVPAAGQLERIEAPVRHALARGALVSIDTTDPDVADAMLKAGAHAINDVSCLAEPELARVTARYGATLILMHARGPMSRMAGFSAYPEQGYSDVVNDVLSEWRTARDTAVTMGLAPGRVWFDPGIGFGKSARHSFSLLNALSFFSGEGVPIVVGPSRKSFIDLVDRGPPQQRLGGSIAAAIAAVERGASVLRVHDVRDMHQALVVSRAIRDVPDAEAARA